MFAAQPVLCQISVSDRNFRPREWIKRLFDEGYLITSAFLPIVVNIETFYVSIPWERNEDHVRFDLMDTEFGQSLNRLWEGSGISHYFVMEIHDEPGLEIHTWANPEPEYNSEWT